MGKKHSFAAPKVCTGNTANSTILSIQSIASCLIEADACSLPPFRNISRHAPFQWVPATYYCASRTAELTATFTSMPHVLVTLIMELTVWSHATTTQFAATMDCFEQYLRFNATKLTP